MAALAALPSLYDCVTELELILETLDALDDTELSASVREQVEIDLIRSLSGTREKIDRTSAVFAAMEAASAAAAKEIERLQARKKRIDTQHARLTAYVIEVLECAGVSKFDGHTSTLAIRKNPAKVVIDPDAYLEIDMLRFPPTPEPEPDKAAIAAALRRGEDVAGCRLVQTTRLVRS
jgi:hypothetical protein